MVQTPEEEREYREQHEPSNMDVIGAYAPLDHLQLFYVGNTAQENLRDRVGMAECKNHCDDGRPHS